MDRGLTVKKSKSVLFYALAFGIPALLMWLIYIAWKVYPFGNNSVLVLDLNAQYVYFFEYFRDVLAGKASLFYSWRRALGGEFLGIFAYYLSSPLSFIVALFPKKMITEALLTMFLIKCGLCGVTMSFYIRRVFHPKSWFRVLTVSTMWSLSSYAVVMQHNTMWTDCLILLPLVVYGIEQLIKKRRFILYTASLALAVMSNFYIGYMMCIFSGIYFFYYYFAKSAFKENNFYGEKAHFIRSLLRFGFFSLIAVLMAVWILYPTYYSLSFGKTTFTNPSHDIKQKFDYLDFLLKLFPGSYDTVRPEGYPFVYCGVLALILMPMYFLSKNVRSREKMLGGGLLVLMVLCFNTSVVDMFWHGMQNPNWLNYRYSFMFIFIVLVFTYKVLDNIEQVDYHKVIAVCAFLVLIVMILQKENYVFTEKMVELGDMTFVWYSLGLIGVFLIVIHALRYGYLAKGASLILCVLVCLEMFCSGIMNVYALDTDVVYSTRNSYVEYLDKYTPIVRKVQEADNGFYRMEKYDHRKTNDDFALGIRGLSNSTSTLNKSQIDLLNTFGYASKSHWSKYLGGTPVSDSLFGIKYIIYSELDKCEFYDFMFDDLSDGHNLYAYHNPYALSLACAVDKSARKFDADVYSSPFDMMNDLVTDMLGSDVKIELFKPLEQYGEETENCLVSFTSGYKKFAKEYSADEARVTYTADVTTGDTIYLFIDSGYPRECDLSVNSEAKGTIFGNETDRIIELGKYNPVDVLNVTLKLNKDDLYVTTDAGSFLYYLDGKVFREVMPLLCRGNMSITEYNDTDIEGTVTAEKDGMLFTSIVYDKNWNVFIDGEKVKTYKTLDALVGLNIKKGTHHVEFRYVPHQFYVGLIISGGAAFVFAGSIAAYILLRRRERRRYIAMYEYDMGIRHRRRRRRRGSNKRIRLKR
ncbi:MAG: YfhO family protein [Clostridia bacterium]|nr:YfhO family protein [Clostridia bacterium]